MPRPLKISRSDARRLGLVLPTSPQRRPGQMTRLEQEYDSRLRALLRLGQIAWVGYESITLRLPGGSRYTPDFIVVTSAGQLECHEVKPGTRRDGKERPWLREDAALKLKAAAAEYWWIVFRIAWRCRRDADWSMTDVP